MIFNYVLGSEDIVKENMKINSRQAIRGVIFKDNNIFMIHTNKGDYKFPGGGIKKGETYEETLKREIKEETGYIVTAVKEKIGVCIERKLDDYEKNSIFQMTSYYYLCEINDNKTLQELDDYEAELNFQPVWILIDSAIESNEKVLKKGQDDINSWVHRETIVLKKLKEYYNSQA